MPSSTNLLSPADLFFFPKIKSRHPEKPSEIRLSGNLPVVERLRQKCVDAQGMYLENF